MTLARALMDATAEEYEQLIEVGVGGRHSLGTQGHVKTRVEALASSLWRRALRMTTKIQQSGTKVLPTARRINIHVRRLPQTAFCKTVDDAPHRATTDDQLNVENNPFLE
jgi:hypothetical protein